MKKSGFEVRREKVAGKLKGLGLDAFVVSDPVNVSYLTGFRGDSSSLIVTSKKTLLVSDARFDEQIEEECPGLDAAIRQPGTTPTQFLGETLAKFQVGKTGFESTHLTVHDLELLEQKASATEWVAKSGVVESLRAIKDADEIAQIAQAIGFAEKAFGMFRAGLRPVDTEKELADAMEGYLRRCGARTCSFPSIIAVGPKAAHAHAIPGDVRIEDDDFVLVDWGARGDFYCSDLTRVLVTRKISAKLREIYGVVLRAQTLAIKGIKPGATGAQIDAIARGVISDAGYGKHFGHGLGHGIGMKVHEAPSLAKSREDVLQPGMVVTVEPGIYIKGWGGVRIEDDVLVTKTGCEVLSSLPKELDQMMVG